jgi:peroxiredoxin
MGFIPGHLPVISAIAHYGKEMEMEIKFLIQNNKMKIFNLIIFLLIVPIYLFSQDIGKPAPEFTGYSVSGDTIKLSDYKGKVIILDFWASWCKPCKEEFPFIIDLFNQYADKNFSVLTVNLDDESGKINKFLTDINKDVPFKIIFDNKSVIPPLYNVDGMPSSFVIDKKGIIRLINVGFKSNDKDKFIKEIELLLN